MNKHRLDGNRSLQYTHKQVELKLTKFHLFNLQTFVSFSSRLIVSINDDDDDDDEVDLRQLSSHATVILWFGLSPVHTGDYSRGFRQL